MDIPILFEDAAICAINKPPGVVVNRAESVKGETVQDWAENVIGGVSQSQPDVTSDDFVSRSGVVHRLDKETSGVLLIAKTPVAFAALQQAFKDRKVRKTYLTLVHGRVAPEEGNINAPVGRLPWNRRHFGIVPEGKAAVTEYTVLAHGTMFGKDMTVVAVMPRSGRTHQIRVHMKYINHPVIGDFQYGGRKQSQRDRNVAGRVMLHAWKIAFSHPVSGETVSLVAPIPDDMRQTMAHCQVSMTF